MSLRTAHAYPDARLYGAPTLVRWNQSLSFAEVLDNGKEVFRTAFRWLLK